MINFIAQIILVSTVKFGPVGFSGSAHFYFEYDTLTGSNQASPAMTARWDFNPSFTIYGLPVKLNLSLESIKNGFLNHVEAFSVTFEPQKLLNYMPSLPGFIFSFPMISIGTTNPEFSKFTFYGTSVEGFTIKYAPGKVYFAITRGKLATTDSLLGEYYTRKVFGYRIGVGAPSGAHFHLIYSHFLDDTMGQPSIDSTPPQENFLIGFNTGLKMKDNVNLQAEVVASEITDDIRDSVIDVNEIPRSLNFLVNHFKPRSSTHVDVAAEARMTIKVKQTHVKTYSLYVGPGFKSFGSTMLKNDVLELGTEFRTTMFKGIISMTGRYSTQRDNLIGTKGITTNNSIYHMDVSIAPPSFPFLSFSGDMTQQTVEDTANGGTQSFTSKFLLVAISYPYMIKNLSLFTQLSVSYQNADMPDTAFHAQTYQMISATQSVAFAFPLTLSLNLTHGAFSSDTTDFSRTTADLSASYTIKKFTPSLGFSYSTSGDENRTDIHFRASYRPGWGVTISTTALYATGQKSDTGEFSEKKFTFLVGKSW